MNIFRSLENKIKTSPRAGEVGAELWVRCNKKQTCGIFFRLFSFILTVIRRNAIFSNKVMDTRLPQPIKQLVAPKYNVCSVGRSMIEMLGVLAIIAVLSVGGIAGYSKAMQQWKLNKWKAQITDIIFAVKDLYKNEKNFGRNGTNLLPLLKQVEAVPQGMLDENNKDLFGNIVSIEIRSDKLIDDSILQRFAIYFQMPVNSEAVQNCRELNYFTQTDPDVHTVVNWANNYRTCGKYVADSYKNTWPCYEYNMQKVAEKCKICKEHSCTLILLYKNN